MCHESSAMVIPILVDRVIRNLFRKLNIQFPQTIDPLQLLISLVHRYITIVLIVQLELIPMSLHHFRETIAIPFVREDGSC